jgi:hypothetical protein
MPAPKEIVTAEKKALESPTNSAPASYLGLARRNDWEGRPLSTAISKSSGFGVLDQAALRADKSRRFQPEPSMALSPSGTLEDSVNFSLNR